MDVKEFYNKIGGSYDTFLQRVLREDRVKKYVLMFKIDPSMNELKAAIDANDIPTAFRSIHTLKGLCANLAFDSFFNVCSVLTEILRNYDGRSFAKELADVEAMYNEIIEAINELD